MSGHVAPGCIVRTTTEVRLALLPEWRLALLPEWRLAREADAGTGFQELVIRPSDLGGG